MNLLEAEERFQAFIEEVQKAVDAFDAIKVTKQPTRVGDMLPDMQLQELVSGKVVGLLSVLQRAPYTLLVLLRHFG